VITSPADEATAYPVFSGDQLDRLRRYGTVHLARTGEVLFSPDDDSYDLLVVLSGQVEVTHESQDGSVPLARHGRGHFAGELNLLTGQRPFLTARATADSEILEITPARLRDLLARETEIADILVQALIARRRRRISGDAAYAAIEIVGTGQSAQALALRSFLSRNTIAYHWVDIDQADAPGDVLSSIGATRDSLPVAITPTRVLMNAGPAELAAVLGLAHRLNDGRLFDVLVAGAGPAGLAAALYGASEGLAVAVVDRTAPGGQAGTSSRIENYLGFPNGISGAELTTRATIQAQRFGALLASPCRVDRITAGGEHFAVLLADGTSVSTRAVVAATGAIYRRLPLPDWQRLEGAGIYYAATALEAELCAGGGVVVLGGGNSAGQAALYLARSCAHVTIVIRRASLAASMSQYLIDRVEANQHISVAATTIIEAVNGRDHLESVTLRNTVTNDIVDVAIRGLFCFIGAKPASRWLRGDVARDEDGFVLTDVAVPSGAFTRRPRLPYETSVDGLFAAGDIRVGSMKRVGAAVGEGSSVIRSVHQYLADCSSAS
jgi:thioredoxin reductase (NADPH)